MTVIKARTSETASAVPTAGQLVRGEIAFNLPDKAIYTKDHVDNVVLLNPTTTLNDTLTSTSTTEAATANKAKELKDLIDGLGSIHEAATIAARDALAVAGTAEYLHLVHVVDDGDGKWARYQNLGTAAAPVWTKISDEDALAAGLGATNLGYTASPTGGTVTNNTGDNATLTLADGTNAGLLAPADKIKLDAAVNAALGVTASPTGVDVTNTAGTDATLPLATTTNSGLMAPADKTKIDAAVNADLNTTVSATGIDVTNTAGANAALPLATIVNAGLLAPADQVKLNNYSNTHIGQSDTPAAYVADRVLFTNLAGDSVEYRDIIDGGTF